MKALYEGKSRKNAILIMIDEAKAVKARMQERRTSKGKKSRLRWWIEDALQNE